MKTKCFVLIAIIMTSYSCKGPGLPPLPDSNGITVKSVSATIRSMPYKSGGKGNSPFAACDVATRHSSGQKMQLRINSSSQPYVYDGSKWIPENEAASFTDNKATEVEISLGGSSNAIMESDRLRYLNMSISPSSKLDGIVLDHTKSLVEFFFIGDEPDNPNDVKAAGSRVFYDESQMVYFAFVEPGLVSLDVTFSHNGDPCQYTYTCPDGLEAGYAYRFNIEATQRVTSLRSVSGLIAPSLRVSEEGSESASENDYAFGKRYRAGQVLEATLGGASAVYNYDIASGKWVPAQGQGLIYQNSESRKMKLLIRPMHDLSQDGTEDTFITADELECAIDDFAPVNELTNAVFTRSRSVIEISAEEGAVQPGTQLSIGREVAFFDNTASRYRIITDAGSSGAEISYTDNNGTRSSLAISPTGGLKPNRVYQRGIVRKDPVTQNTPLKSVNCVSSDFADRYVAGQRMYVTIDGSAPVEYIYCGTDWVPSADPAEFDGNKWEHDMSIVVKSENGLAQDGTYNGFLRCDELKYNTTEQASAERIAGIELEHTNPLLEITFAEMTPSDGIVTINGSIRAFSRYINDGGVDKYVSSAIIPAGTASVSAVMSFDGTGDKTYIFTPAGGFVGGNIYTETISYNNAQPGYTEGAGDGADAPIVLYDSSDHSRVRVISVGRQGNIIDVTLFKSDIPALSVITNDGKHRFEVDIKPDMADNSACEFTEPTKVLAASDFNGNFEAFHAFLSGNGVIDTNYDWAYGKNHVVIAGDATGFGRNDIAILWLCYKLDRQAVAAGGRFHYLIGDEDEKILRYEHDTANSANTYKQVYNRIVQDYRELWADNSELGNWLAERNVAIKIGNDIYMHGGLHRGLIDDNYTIGEINYLFKYNVRSASRSTRCKAVFAAASEVIPGPIACRNYIDSSYAKVLAGDLDYVLGECGAERMIVGNCIVSDVRYADLREYGTKIIAIAVDHSRYTSNPSRERDAGMLVESGAYYSVSYSGGRVRLNQW